MDKETASKIIRETFNNSFDKDRFIRFTKELFNYYEPDTFIYRGNFIPDAFDPQIKTLERVGKYTDPDGNKIDILIVQLKRASSIERARRMQRNFIAWYLNGSRGGELKDAAIVAFVAPDHDDWRFSLVKMDYHLEEGKGGKVKTRKELTPARRWSFLVGKNENSHTAQKQLLEILQNDSDNQVLKYDRPLLSDLQQAFNIEKVTKEFFEKYRELFINVKEALQYIVKTNQSVRNDFNEKSIDTVDFSKKLLGQIVFLYFLQKKGWFGVPRGKNWGEGDKHFLRHLQEKAEQKNKNFFNDYLEPLFYQALRYDRSADDDYFSQFDCKIPFLNGGLFDPMKDYDWINTDIVLPNDLFANERKNKEGDIGTGVLDVFDRYNFTVKEDEPLEKDVAVDPEMLGKVFENLLEVKDRKSKGTYYTPREIVHYMCQESLANYLATELSSVIPAKAGIQLPTKEDIETLIKFGETAVEHDSRVATKGLETKSYSFKLPESIRQNAKLIDEKLATIRVCDPAVGSGAFPVGMMSEIIKTRNALTPYILSRHSDSEPAEEEESRTPYNFKRHAVQNSLYGVDIDPGAVEIAKLRLWLSLVVDEEDRDKIQPLPNLDYKIMQGNSLISQFMKIDFDREDTSRNGQLLISQDDTDSLIEKLKNKKDEYLNKASTSEKQKLKQEIEDLIITIFETKLQKQKADYFNKINAIEEKYKNLPNTEQRESLIQAEKEKLYKISGFNLEQFEQQLREYITGNKIRPFFPWRLYFAEVFHEKKGFDVVIVNPPYVGHKGGQKLFFKKIRDTSLGKRFNNERMDLFYYFYHLALDITHDKGKVTFITTNYYVTADSAIKLRKDFKNRAVVVKFVNFNELKIFDSARGQHNMLTFLSKKHGIADNQCDIYSTSRTGLVTPDLLISILNRTDKETIYIRKEQEDLYEGQNDYIRVPSLVGGEYETIENLLNKVKQKSLLLINLCNISQGVVTGLDKISKKHIRKIPSLRNKQGAGVYVLNKAEKMEVGDSPVIKPWIKNSDIYRFKVFNRNNLRVVHVNADTNLDKYPNVKEHLARYKKVIELRNYDSGELSKAKKLKAWWALSSSRKEFDFSQPKIVSPQRSNRNTFAYIEKERLASADVYFITQKDQSIDLKYVLSLLNSRLYFVWLYHKGKRKGRMLELYLTPLSEIPIKNISKGEQKPFIDFVDKILAITKDDDYLENPVKQAKACLSEDARRQVREYEKQIDQLVYKLYDLTPDEIAIVEGKNRQQ